MLQTYDPLYTLKPIGDDIWIVDGDVIKMNFGPIKVPFTTRMTIIRLKDGLLWIHSPINLTKDLIKRVNELGEVAFLISPNKLHYEYINQWQSEYPNAQTFASPGVIKRSEKQGLQIKFHERLTQTPPIFWEDDIDQLIFQGSVAVEEVVFFHKTSNTLILTDLIENFEPSKVNNFFWRFVMRVAGITAPHGSTPRDFRGTFINKKRARVQLEKMMAWQPEKIVIAHGKWFEENGVDELKRAFKWLIK